MRLPVTVFPTTVILASTSGWTVSGVRVVDTSSSAGIGAD
jgi:hypothetical protein